MGSFKEVSHGLIAEPAYVIVQVKKDGWVTEGIGMVCFRHVSHVQELRVGDFFP